MASFELLQKLKNRQRPLVMGILNVTPDSFSDGGRYSQVDTALERARIILAEGADIIDVGGESTRPGAEAVSVADELQRVIPVVAALVNDLGALVSVDTSKAELMEAAIGEGVAMINDVQALSSPGAMEAVASSEVLVCLMHMQGLPRTMQQDPQYQDVVNDIIDFLKTRARDCVSAGIEANRIIVDPGFGFGKSLTHNYTIMRELRRFSEIGYDLLTGLSRKSMIGMLLNTPVEQRLIGSVVLAALAAERGSAILRVHDVRETVEAMRLVQAVQTLGLTEEK